MRGWSTSAAHALRDLASPERVAQLSHRDLRCDFPSLSTRSTKVSQRKWPGHHHVDYRKRLHGKGFGSEWQTKTQRGAVVYADKIFYAVKNRLSTT